MPVGLSQSGDTRGTAVQGSQVPSGDMFDAPGTSTEREGLTSFEPHEDAQEILRAWLRSGNEAVLLGARIEHLFPQTSRVASRMALIGWRIPENLQFDAVRFQVGGLTELAGVYPLKSVTLPKTLDGDAEFGATWNAEMAEQTWTTDSEPFPTWLGHVKLQCVDGLGEFPCARRAAAELVEDVPCLELGVRSLAGAAEFRMGAVGLFLGLGLVLAGVGDLRPGAALVALIGQGDQAGFFQLVEDSPDPLGFLVVD